MFTQVQEQDLEGKGVVGQPAVPGLSVEEMQQSVEQIVREVAIPAVNRLVEELAAATAAQNVGAQMPQSIEGEGSTVQSVLAALAEYARTHAANTKNPHAVTAAQAGAYTKAETESRIDAKMIEIGAGDMAKSVYDPQGRQTEVFAAIPHENVLDNTDFKKPVNQRGAAGTVSAAGYFIDRWKLVSGTVQLTANGLILNGTIAQVLEHAAGTDVTASSSAGTASYNNGTKIFTLTATGQTIAWAKLEQGDVATAWQSKGYGAELAACLRFFERIGTAQSPFLGSLCKVDNTKLLPVTISFYPKRAAPSIQFSNVSQYRALMYNQSGVATGAVNIASFTKTESAIPSCAAFFAYVPTMSESTVYAIIQRQDTSTSAWIDVSADL